MFKSPLMNGSAFFIFCSKVVRLTTMMVDPVDDLENLHLAGLDDIGQVAFFAFLENPVPGLQGLPLKYGF